MGEYGAGSQRNNNKDPSIVKAQFFFVSLSVHVFRYKYLLQYCLEYVSLNNHDVYAQKITGQ